MKRLLTSLLLAGFVAGVPAVADTDPLAAFSGMVGKTWRGTPTGDSTTKVDDIAHWEYVLGGRAVRSTHALADGSYGGETLIYWDAGSKSLAYVYVTTAHFRTEGTMVANGDTWTGEEAVTGHPEIVKVRSTCKLGADGAMTMTSEYQDRKGNWSPGHGFVYKVDAAAAPALKLK